MTRLKILSSVQDIIFNTMRHIRPVLGNDREKINYTTADFANASFLLTPLSNNLTSEARSFLCGQCLEVEAGRELSTEHSQGHAQREYSWEFSRRVQEVGVS
jgi:hypothetical protein